jgi:type IV pilus assembly protein PilM
MAIVSLSGLNSLYRIVSLPQIPDNLLTEAIKREAERVLPVALNDVYLSYQLIPGKAEERRVFLAAFPKPPTDSLIRTLRRAGIEPYLMDLAPLALARTVNLERTIVVNLRGINLDIVVMVDRIPQVLRSLPLSGETESTTEKLVAIAEEIERTFAFYNQSQQGSSFDEKVPVLVTGDLGAMRDSWELLSSRLGHPVDALTSPMQDAVGFDASQFMINIGLILKEAPREKGTNPSSLINFNALPSSYRRTMISPVNILVPVVSLVALAVVIVMGYMTMGISTHIGLLDAEAANIQAQIKTQAAEVKALQLKIGQLQEQVKPIEDRTKLITAKLEKLKNSRVKTDENTNKVVNLLPDDMEITSLSYGGAGVTLDGTGDKLNDVYGYARSIRSTNLFFVILTTISYVEGDETTEPYYTYSFTLLPR